MKATIIFPKRQYIIDLKSAKKQKKSLVDSCDFWNAKITSTWGLIRALSFIREFKGLDHTGFSLEQLMAVILAISESEKRLRVLKALQKKELYIRPAYLFPDKWNYWAYKAFKRVLNDSDKQTFVVVTNEETFIIRTPDPQIWQCVYMTFQTLEQRAEAMTAKFLKYKAKKHEPFLAELVGTKRARI